MSGLVHGTGPTGDGPSFARPSGQDVLSFGKHKGRTYESMARDLPGYCEWILRTNQASKSLCDGFARFAEYLRAQSAQPAPKAAMPSQPSQAPHAPTPLTAAQYAALPHAATPHVAPPHAAAAVPVAGAAPFFGMPPPGCFYGMPPWMGPMTAMPRGMGRPPLPCWPPPWCPPFFPATPLRPQHPAATVRPAASGKSSKPAHFSAAPDLESERKSAKRLKLENEQRRARQTLATSAFLGLYGAAPAKPTARDCLLAVGNSPILEEVTTALSELPADADSLDRYVVKLWAILTGTAKEKGGIAFYKILNDAVIADDAEQLKLMMPLARVLNKILVSYFPSTDVVTYRGSQMTKSHYSAIHAGTQYRVAMFVASSLDFDVAERFVRFEPERVIIKFLIPEGCNNAGFLGVEFYPEQEREYLMPPYTAIEIMSKSCFREYLLLSVRVCKDNKDSPLDLPSILL